MLMHGADFYSGQMVLSMCHNSNQRLGKIPTTHSVRTGLTNSEYEDYLPTNFLVSCQTK